MNENRYGVLPFFLALLSLVISTLFFTLPSFARSGIISTEAMHPIWVWGWIPGFVLALVSLNMVSSSRNLHRKVFVWVFSLLAIIADMVWATAAFGIFMDGP